MFSLLAVGISIPYAYSFASLLWETVFPTAGRGEHVVHFETAAMITTLAWLGQYLELRARLKSTGAIRQLWSLLPQTAMVVFADASEALMEVTHLLEGCLVRVRAGDKVPADGYVLSGTGSLDESAFTGEPMPVFKEPGAAVKAGMLNHDGTFVMKTTAVGTHTLLSQIVHMVSTAQRSRVPMQQLVDAVAAAFVPIVAIVAAAAFAGWLYAGAGIITSLTVVTSVFVVACPCALGLATPMSIVVAIGRAALSGILVKDAGSLQALTRIKTIVFDKTGTLTEGKPALVAISLATDASEAEALGLAASLSKGSSHPLSSAITTAATTRGLPIPECHEFNYTPGGGSSARVGDRHAVLGNTRFLNEMGISVDSVPIRTSSYLAVDGQVLAQLEFEDPVKPSAQQAVRALQVAGMRLILATGDGATPAAAIAKQLGITEVRTQQTPGDKVNLIRQLQSEGIRVAMIGDGVNDAPALAQADVGIAMSTGSDIAVDSAGITLVRGDLAGVDFALKLSRAMINNIRQNLVLAFAYNVIAVPIAAGILLPAFGLLLNPMVAALAMSLSSLAVVGNALRLRHLSL
jgi:Cu+-exporting ATPase